MEFSIKDSIVDIVQYEDDVVTKFLKPYDGDTFNLHEVAVEDILLSRKPYLK
jgi:hypothetical protein